jgi:tRNA (cytidine/uridine-2'-O-)-methyltransferase
MLHLALWEPEIPPNTGNIARLCAATDTRLHIIGKPSFRLDDRAVRRAGLDYWESVDLKIHPDFDSFEKSITIERLLCIETTIQKYYTQAPYCDDCCILFGNESRGLPTSIQERFAERIFGIPMPSGKVRSLNLANSAAIVLYEALRQLNNW